MRTVPDIAKEQGEAIITNEHVFLWVSMMLADESVDVRSEFPLSVCDGEYSVTLTARPKR